MNILIDIGHPAHVHIFKEIAKILVSKGDKVFFTVREGEKESELLNSLKLPYSVIGKKRKSLSGKLVWLLVFTFRILVISKRQKTDMFLSHGSMYAGIASFFRRKPHIALEDTGNMEQLLISKPFSDVILSPDSLKLDLGKKHIKYKGIHELYYLCPTCFSPDPAVKTLLGIQKNENYCLLRFISWGATHDKGHAGINDQGKNELINYLKGRYRLFISSESELPENLKQYKFPLSPEWLHHAIAFSEIVITEGATIASESTLLGIPVIYINSRESDLIDEHEKWGLLVHFRNFEGVLEKVSELINDPFSRSNYTAKRDEMLRTKIDVTSFLVWFIEKFPDSFRIIKESNDYQDRFKYMS